MAKPALILLPGMLNTSQVWQAAADRLSGGAEICAVDGLTQNSMRAMADHAWDCARGLAKPAFIAGFSMGGLVAMQMAHDRPQDAAGLALVNTASRAAGGKEREIAAKSIAAAERDTEKFLASVARLGLLPAHEGESRFADAQLPMMREIGLAGFLNQQAALLGRAAPAELLRGFAKPVTILCSEADRVTPKFLSDELLAMLPGAAFEVIPDAGHWTLLEAPDAVAAALKRWLKA